ncbi:hypothetical protein DSO57_1034729 [Entomophthora muscae]|uniref:Uncharacterized protein n=1 Tax=Entomophthora muscae TaxID=34485 RepID=A0ACC2SCP2_9FUNG|nr:hypothetical protein DSO57_1034729 [Entomophthora muscae]
MPDLSIKGLPACPRFLGVEPPQAEAKNNCPKGRASQTKGIIAPNRGVIKAPNESNEIPTVFFMGLETASVANQDVSLSGTHLTGNKFPIWWTKAPKLSPAITESTGTVIIAR